MTPDYSTLSREDLIDLLAKINARYEKAIKATSNVRIIEESLIEKAALVCESMYQADFRAVEERAICKACAAAIRETLNDR